MPDGCGLQMLAPYPGATRIGTAAFLLAVPPAAATRCFFFFTFTVLAQFLYTRQLLRHKSELQPVARHLKAMLLLGLFILILGLISLGATTALEDPAKDRWENVTEWWFALAMMTYFGVSAVLWQRVSFKIS